MNRKANIKKLEMAQQEINRVLEQEVDASKTNSAKKLISFCLDDFNRAFELILNIMRKREENGN